MPSRARQRERLNDRFRDLQTALSRGIEVIDGVPLGDPELVVVFEVIEESIDLENAMHRVGLELLVDDEADIGDDELDEDFARTPSTTGRVRQPVKRYLHAVMASSLALQQLLALWAQWVSNERLEIEGEPYGLGAFGKLFASLHNVRAWDPSDRIRMTGLAEALAHYVPTDTIPVQIELAFRTNEQNRQRSEDAFAVLVEGLGGEILARSVIPEIRYHALAATVPGSALQGVAAGNLDVQLLRAPSVLFVRPAGQSMLTDDDEGDEGPLGGTTATGPRAFDPPSESEPVVAVLDGMPVANHVRLRGRVEVFDPDQIGERSDYAARLRVHGLGVVSAVVCGDLGRDEEPLDRVVLVRPILAPDPKGTGEEIIPWEVLPPSLIIRAVQEILAVHPSIKVVNLSVTDTLAQFDVAPSAWARALDWMAAKHSLLFIVAAGNHACLVHPLDDARVRSATPSDLSEITKRALLDASPERRLRPPAESINALTVGATHADASKSNLQATAVVDLWPDQKGPSAVSASGRGIRRSVKPELLAAGGRRAFRRTGVAGQGHRYEAARSPRWGVEVAAPEGGTRFDGGTTFAAAEMARQAARLVEMLLAHPEVPESHLTVCTKALLVHGAELPPKRERQPGDDKLHGYGYFIREYTAGCPGHRATLLAFGDLGPGEYTDVLVPLPREIAINEARDLRRITATLAWFSPINAGHRQYRQAKLEIGLPAELPRAAKTPDDVGANLGGRGTVQQRVFSAKAAVAADAMTFTVKCSGQAGKLGGTVPFALALSIDLGVNTTLDVYGLVSTAIQMGVQVRV